MRNSTGVQGLGLAKMLLAKRASNFEKQLALLEIYSPNVKKI